jgi:hypothetical protein
VASLIVSFASAEAAKLPFVTLKDFEVFCSSTRDTTGIETIIFAPLLETTDMRNQWKNYSHTHQDWAEEVIVGDLWRLDAVEARVADKSDPPYSPVWQTSPPEGAPVNYNLQTFKSIVPYLNHVAKNKQTAMMSVVDLKSFLSTVSDETSVIVVPVFDSLQDKDNKRVIGHLLAVIPWSAIFAGTSKEGQADIHVVVDICGVSARMCDLCK